MLSPLNRTGCATPENPHGTLTNDERIRRGFISFTLQKGPVDEVGINGCFLQDVIEMLIEKIDIFNRGKLACRENSLAKTDLENAWYKLQMRRDAREREGVLSTMEPHGQLPPALAARYRDKLTPTEVPIDLDKMEHTDVHQKLNLATDLFPPEYTKSRNESSGSPYRD